MGDISKGVANTLYPAKRKKKKKYELQHYLGKLVLTEVHVPQVDQALQATRYVVQGALRVPAHRYKFKTR
jgi:hypothetical protein